MDTIYHRMQKQREAYRRLVHIESEYLSNDELSHTAFEMDLSIEQVARIMKF